jgi:hypothetical protein
VPELSEPGKTVYLRIGVWWNEEQGHIHIAAQDVEGFHTTVNDDPESMRGHPNLFRKLAGVLRDAGAPYPPPRGL